MRRARILVMWWAVVLSAVGAFVALAHGAPAALARGPSPSPTPAPAPGPTVPANPPDQIVLSGRVVVPRGQTVDEIVVFTGRVQIAGVVTGDVVVLDGPVLVTGQVSGAVVALDGSVRLGTGAQVGGDVIARQDVAVATGAQVGGRVRAHAAFTLRAPLEAVGRFASWLAVSISTLLLGLLLLLLAPRGADRVEAAARTAPWASTAWGLAMALAVPALAVGLLLTLVGLPLGLVVLLALALVAFVAYAWSVYALGRLLVRERGRALAFLAGWALARGIGLIPIVSGITFLLAAVFGLGAMTVAIWRARGVRPRRGGSHRRGYTPPEQVIRLDEPAAEPPTSEPIA